MTASYCRLARLGCLLFVVAVSGCQFAPMRAPQKWTLVPTDTQASLRGLAAVDAQVAFVSGSGGTLLRTLDGGATWTDIAPPATDDCDFRDVEAFDRNHVIAMVAGQPARVYRTADSGLTWRVVHSDQRPAAFFDAMAFAGEYGVMFGDAIDGQFCLLESKDAGRTWQDRSGLMLPAPLAGEAAFAASGTCLAAFDGASKAFSLVTGGGPCRVIKLGPEVVGSGAKKYWWRNLPLHNGGSSKGAFSIAWNGDLGVVVGGDYADPDVHKASGAVSVDGGDTWSVVDAGGFRSAVVWFDAKCLLAVGSDGASWSFDSGRNWKPFGKMGFHALSKASDGSVWASGSNGRVARLVPRD